MKVWQNRSTERKVNHKIDEYEQEDLDKVLQVSYAHIRSRCIVENIINKKNRMNLLEYFLIYGRL